MSLYADIISGTRSPKTFIHTVSQGSLVSEKVSELQPRGRKYKSPAFNEYFLFTSIKSCFRFKEETIEELLIKALFKSKSNLVVINASDMLLLNDDYRMNEPSTNNDKNWGFRLTTFKDLFKLKNKYKTN